MTACITAASVSCTCLHLRQRQAGEAHRERCRRSGTDACGRRPAQTERRIYRVRADLLALVGFALALVGFALTVTGQRFAAGFALTVTGLLTVPHGGAPACRAR